jgi:hypothetical protein
MAAVLAVGWDDWSVKDAVELARAIRREAMNAEEDDEA